VRLREIGGDARFFLKILVPKGIRGFTKPANKGNEGEKPLGYRSDLLVDNLVIVETKSVQAIHTACEAQLLSYLRLSERPLDY